MREIQSKHNSEAKIGRDYSVPNGDEN